MLGLTKEERRALIFLLCITIIGMGLNFLFKRNPSFKTVSGLYQDLGKVHLNRADKNMLINVPGIGEKLAMRILEYRKEHGSFSSIEELKNIKGMNNYRYEKIKDYFLLN